MISVKNLSKEFLDYTGYRIPVFNNISFNIDEGRVNSLIAPLGSGKSTLLKIVAGLLKYDDGEIINPNNHKIVFIPSKPSSFPWFSVKENIQLAAVDSSQKNVFSLIQKVGLEGYENHHPHNNSIGFRFRISLARALAADAKLILLDEPFNEIPSVYKNDIYKLIRKISQELKTTFLLATTNITEAVYLSDKIILMKKNSEGELKEIYLELSSQRDISFFFGKNYIEIKSEIEQYFKREQADQFFKVTL